MALVQVNLRRWDFTRHVQDLAESLWPTPEPVTVQRYGFRDYITVSGSTEIPVYRLSSAWWVDDADVP